MAQGKSIFETKKGKTNLNYAYSWGAAIVILGALFKIMHWPGANIMLIVGMTMEVIIFIISGFEPQHDSLPDYEWDRVYPELAHSGAGAQSKGSPMKQLDDALAKAKIEGDMLSRLGENMGKFSENVKGMNNVTSAMGATDEYTKNASAAAKSLSTLQSAFDSSAAAAKDLSAATAGTKEYHAQVQTITKNLANLNSMYEIEISDANNHIKSMNKFVGNLAEAMNSLESTKADAVSLKDNMSSLSKSLTSLNGIYGGMLSAMRTAN
jgi:gliding motility-associated protein GldL